MRKLTRREMFAAAGFGIGGAILARTVAAVAVAAERPPNIIFILSDDLGYGDLGCYGQRQIATPHLDGLAAEGIRFTQCYAGSTVCAPSRCCLMTGYHTGHARIRGNATVPLGPEDVTVAELLKKAGYATALVGKWGLGENGTTGVPNKKGFDEFFGYLNQGKAHNYYPEFLWRNETKVRLDGNIESKEHSNVSAECKTYSNDLFTKEAIDFIQRKKGGPFFLYLAYTIPHANDERGAAEGDGMEVPDYGAYADKSWPKPQRGHAAMISRMDDQIGQIMKKLQDLGIDDNTVVFFTSDNGPHKEGGADPAFFKSAGPLRGYKRALYEGGIRVPMIARWPGKITKGATSNDVWAFWDFLPTAAELAGCLNTVPAGIDGISVAPALFGKEQKKHGYLYWEFHEGGYARAVRMGNWKGVKRKPALPLELYDLDADVGETKDVAAANPEIVAKLEGILKTARTPSKEWPGK